MTRKSRIILCLAVFVLFSMNALANTSDEREERVNRIIEEYMNTKNALVHDRTDLSGPWAERLETTLATTPNELFNEDELPGWQAIQSDMMSALGDMIDSDEITVHRQALARLSAGLEQLVETFGNPSGDLYVIVCKDFGDDNVIWLNNSESISNPYHGPKNLNCGEVLSQM